MPTGSPGRIRAPAGPSRSADSERTVTRVLRSMREHILYTRRVLVQRLEDPRVEATGGFGPHRFEDDAGRARPFHARSLELREWRAREFRDPPERLREELEIRGE